MLQHGQFYGTKELHFLMWRTKKRIEFIHFDMVFGDSETKSYSTKKERTMEVATLTSLMTGLQKLGLQF